MALLDLHHVTIKARDLEETERFYVEILGMEKVARPEFDFPGAWLQMGRTMFHLMGGYMAVDDQGRFEEGGAAVDHIAMLAKGYDEMKARLLAHGLKVSESIITSPPLWQLFVDDPNGVRLEMNFNSSEEPEDARGPDVGSPRA
ncbi:MAG: VOC family protein [Alphaproteobacteria bacterium]